MKSKLLGLGAILGFVFLAHIANTLYEEHTSHNTGAWGIIVVLLFVGSLLVAIGGSWKSSLEIVSGVLGFVVPTYFAWTLYIEHAPQSVATWGMTFVLDGLGLLLAWKGGNEKPYMQVGFVIAALCIFSAVLFNGTPLAWGWTETASVILCGVAIRLWLTRGPLVAQWAYMTAVYISFVPLILQYADVPQTETLWLWLWSIIACLIAILGTEKRDFAHTFVPWGFIGLNAIVVGLCVV